MNRFLIIIAVLFAIPGHAFAAREAVVTALDDKEIFQNEWVDLTVTVKIDHVHLMPLESDDFKIQELRTQRRPGCGFGHGARKEIMMGPCDFVYRLTPKRTGSLITPVATIRGDGFMRNRRSTADSGTFEVLVKEGRGDKVKRVKKTAKAKARREEKARAKQGQIITTPEVFQLGLDELERPESLSQYDVFVLPRIYNTSPFVSEPFRVDYLLYVAEDARINEIGAAQLPDNDGFRRESVNDKVEKLGSQLLGDRSYRMFSLGSYVLIPLEAGTHQIKPVGVQVVGSQTIRHQTGFTISISTNSRPMDVRGPIIDLPIAPLPDPSPKGISGVNVGSFQLTELELPEGREAGNWLFLKYKIVGKGNLFGLEPPSLKGIPGVTFREASVDRDGIEIDEAGVHGTMVVSIPFRTDRVGALELGRLRLDYLDPEDGIYKSSSLELATLEMIRPTTENRLPEVKSLPDRARPVVSADLTQLRLNSTSGMGLWFYLVVAGLMLFGLAPWILRWGAILGKLLGTNHRAAGAQASRALGELAKAQDKGPQEFYSELARILTGFISAKFTLSVTGMTSAELRKRLIDRGISRDLIDRLREELDACDFARFAPGAGEAASKQEALERVKKIIAALDQNGARIDESNK
jgi:hypothetical protein